MELIAQTSRIPLLEMKGKGIIKRVNSKNKYVIRELVKCSQC